MEGYLLLQYVKKRLPMSKKIQQHCTRYDSDLLTAACLFHLLKNTCD